jgi:hypothetical protein
VLLPTLVRGEVFVFRDAGLYYYPLYEWIGSQWREHGSVPLWNPFENGGLPLLCDPTAALWYPGKWIFAAPLPYSTCFQLFLCGHLMVGWWGVFYTCRTWNRSRLAATIAATSYAYGGYVLFQVSNPPYLIGAAWLPWAIGLGECALRSARLRGSGGFRRALPSPSSIATSGCLSLMMLGGDPQTAYHCFVIFGLYVIGRMRWASFVRIAWIASVTIVLSAIVILPSTSWVDSTDRVPQSPRSVWQLKNSVDVPGQWRRLFERPVEGKHEERIYRYSYPPSRWSEFVWPNVSGDLFPANRRWIKRWPEHRRTWVPSLYLGLGALIMAASVARFRNADRRIVWLSRTLLLSLLAACGRFGLVAVVERFAGESGLHGAVGGIYHTMVVVLPGYDFFRYPAKWLLFSSLATCFLSSWGIDSLLASRANPRRTLAKNSALRCSAILTLLTAAALSMHLLGYSNSWFDAKDVVTDQLFGPLDAEGARAGVTQALLHALIVLGIWLTIQRAFGLGKSRGPNGAPQNSRHQPSTRRRLLSWSLLAITCLDLVSANRRLVPSAVPSPAERPISLIAGAASGRDSFPLRLERIDTTRYRAVDSANLNQTRWAEAQHKIVPKLHLRLSQPIELVGVHGSAAPRDWAQLEQAAGVREQFLTLIGVDGTIRFEQSDGEIEQTFVPRTSEPRVWLAKEVIHLEQPAAEFPDEVTWSDVVQRQPGTAYIQGNTQGGGATNTSENLANKPLASNEYVRCPLYTPNRIELETTTIAPRWLVLNDRFHPGWEARLATEPTRKLPILCANGWARVFRVPAGKQRIVMRFRPSELYSGATISVLGWLLGLGFLLYRGLILRKKSRRV